MIVLISSGVGIACAAQVHPSVPGVLLQLGAIGCEAVRLCLVNLLLTLRGLRLSPVASVLLISPICALCLGCVAAPSVCSSSSCHPRRDP